MFNKAKQHRPSIIFLDEFDGLAPKRGQNNDSGNVMERVVSQFINEVDTVNIDV